MRDGVKFFGSMFAWALFCNALMGSMPKNPPAYIIMPFAAFAILGLIGVPAFVAWGWKDAKGLVSLTTMTWLGAAAVALIVIIALGL